MKYLRPRTRVATYKGYINPSINNKKLFEKPIKPEVLDILKYIHNSR